jgi:hypothetical protein
MKALMLKVAAVFAVAFYVGIAVGVAYQSDPFGLVSAGLVVLVGLLGLVLLFPGKFK